MISYRDMTFCSSDCDNMECFRYFDAGVAKDAEDAGLPVSLANYSSRCEYYNKRKNNNEQ